MVDAKIKADKATTGALLMVEGCWISSHICLYTTSNDDLQIVSHNSVMLISEQLAQVTLQTNSGHARCHYKHSNAYL